MAGKVSIGTKRVPVMTDPVAKRKRPTGVWTPSKKQGKKPQKAKKPIT